MTWLDGLLSESARYSAIAKPWYAAKGKPYPGDSAQPLIDAVVANRGEADKNIGLVVLSPEQVARGIAPTK
jgi:hypothetical protein